MMNAQPNSLPDSLPYSLPKGQRERTDFPRFGLIPLAKRFPKDGSRKLEIFGDVAQPITLSDALEGLPRVEQVSDFHCVTTWSYRNLRWGGVRFVDFYDRVIRRDVRPYEAATLLALRSQDGARTSLLLEDLLSPDVLLADRLNGEPLTVEHGAPLRLIAPKHYGYKSVKYLSQVEFKRPEAGYRFTGFRFMDHPRARVGLEERGRGLPGWLYRYLYRPLIPTTVRVFAAATRRYRDHN
jgi:DMSO/TMAO reductase YedYZ molybdopterin-dependent catalytic subunit